jgi:hypothetical protein
MVVEVPVKAILNGNKQDAQTLRAHVHNGTVASNGNGARLLFHLFLYRVAETGLANGVGDGLFLGFYDELSG